MARTTRQTSEREHPSSGGYHPASPRATTTRASTARATPRPAVHRPPARKPALPQSVGSRATAAVKRVVRRKPAPETGSSIKLDHNVLQVRVPMPEVHLSWQKQLFLFALVSLAAVAAMLLLRSWVSQLGAWGYAGAFVISMLSSASIVLPAPGTAIIVVMAQDYNPWLLGLSAGLGGGVGGTTAYLMGRLASRSLQKKRFYHLGNKLMTRVGALLIFIFNLIPFLPGDLISLLAGATRYRFKRFFAWMTLAYVIKMVAICYAATASVIWIQQWMDKLGL